MLVCESTLYGEPHVSPRSLRVNSIRSVFAHKAQNPGLQVLLEPCAPLRQATNMDRVSSGRHGFGCLAAPINAPVRLRLPSVHSKKRGPARDSKRSELRRKSKLVPAAHVGGSAPHAWPWRDAPHRGLLRVDDLPWRGL